MLNRSSFCFDNAVDNAINLILVQAARFPNSPRQVLVCVPYDARGKHHTPVLNSDEHRLRNTFDEDTVVTYCDSISGSTGRAVARGINYPSN